MCKPQTMREYLNDRRAYEPVVEPILADQWLVIFAAIVVGWVLGANW